MLEGPAIMDRQDFGHYLITRFNVPVPGWDRDRRGMPTRDDAWLEHRLRLFTDYCLPTVRGQAATNFTWILGFDRGMPESHRLSIRAVLDEIPQVEWIEAGDHDDFMRQLRVRLAGDPAPYLVTSRLDNDDGLGTDYIRAVQAAFVPEDKRLLNLTGGIAYDITQRVLTRIRMARRNHFTSLIEANDQSGNLLTVIGFPHHHPPASVHLVELPTRFGWLKIVHGRNVSSRLKGIPVFGRLPEGAFAVDPGKLAAAFMPTLAYAVRRLWRILKDRLS